MSGTRSGLLSASIFLESRSILNVAYEELTAIRAAEAKQSLLAQLASRTVSLVHHESRMPAKKVRATSKSALPLTASHPSLLVGGTDQTLRRVTLGLAVLGWVLADIRAGFGKLVHVSPFQYVALQAIARVTADEPWTTQSVARHFRVTKAFVSMELKPLIAKDLIRADPTAADKRSKIFSLTEHGTHALVALAPVQQKINDLLYSQFDSAGLVQLSETIERMLTDAEQASEYLKQLLARRKFEIGLSDDTEREQ